MLQSVPRLLMAPPLPPFDGTAPFQQGMDLLVPRDGGVYFVHDLRGLLYIGRSTDLRRRYGEHYWLNGNPYLALAVRNPAGALNFSWVLCDGIDQHRLESTLIAAYQPPCNRLGFGKEN